MLLRVLILSRSNRGDEKRLTLAAKVACNDLKTLRRFIDENPEYLLILSSDHGVDAVCAVVLPNILIRTTFLFLAMLVCISIILSIIASHHRYHCYILFDAVTKSSQSNCCHQRHTSQSFVFFSFLFFLTLVIFLLSCVDSMPMEDMYCTASRKAEMKDICCSTILC